MYVASLIHDDDEPTALRKRDLHVLPDVGDYDERVELHRFLGSSTRSRRMVLV